MNRQGYVRGLILMGFMFMGSVYAPPPAMKNSAGTCFINAVLQNMFNMIELNNDLMLMPLGKNQIIDEYLWLYQKVRRGERGPLNAEKFFKMVDPSYYDSGEPPITAFNMIMEKMIPVGSPLYAKWSGMFTQIKTQDNITTQIPFDGFIYILEHPASLIREIQTIQDLQGIALEDARKKLDPAIVIKRWSIQDLFDEEYKNERIQNVLSKDAHYIVLAFDRGTLIHLIGNSQPRIDIPKYVDVLVKASPGVIKRFELMGIVCGFGGHAFTFIAEAYDLNKRWYLCDDESITLVPDMFDKNDKVRGNLTHNPHLTAQMLFYKAVEVGGKLFNPVPFPLEPYLIKLFDRDLQVLVRHMRP